MRISLLLSILTLSIGVVADSAEQNCSNEFFAQNHRVVLSNHGSTPLEEARQIIRKEPETLQIVAQFYHATTQETGESIPILGLVVELRSSAQPVLDKLSNISGVSVSCISRASFDSEMNFVSF